MLERVNLEMAHRRVSNDVEQHDTEKQELKTGCYYSSQIKKLRVALIASNSP